MTLDRKGLRIVKLPSPLRAALGATLSLLALGLSGQWSDLHAMPPYEGGDGSAPSPKLAAATALYNQMRPAFAERGIDQPGGGLMAGYQFNGNFKVLAICVDFPDKPSSVPAIKFDTLIFGNQPGTVRDFYSEMAYGTLTIITVNLPSALGWKRLPNNYAYYVSNSYGLGAYPNNTQKLCEELVDLVDPYVNFADYDNDGNGYVDGLLIVHPGRGAEFSGSTSDIWSHKWGITPRLKDGVYIGPYTVQPEYWNTPGDMTIGVYAHETGHLFGLPDLYDVDGSSRGIGKWSLMSSGCWNGTLGSSPAYMDAWCRARLGLVTPTNVTKNLSGASIDQIETNPIVYRLWDNGNIGNEYFLIENRQKVGYDSFLPSTGLMIWHIDDSRGTNNTEWYPGHTTNGNYLVALVQADGLFQMEQNASNGDNFDPYPGSGDKTTFSSATTPSSNSYAGTPTYVTVTNISPSAATMTADFRVAIIADVLDSSQSEQIVPEKISLINSPNPFNPSTTVQFQSTESGPASVMIYDILGRRVRTLYSGYADPGAHQIEWDGDDDSGRQLASGVYFSRLIDGRQSVTHEMVLLR
jgi:immune inhibitor A